MARPDVPEGFRPVPDNLPALQRPPALRPAEEARERYWILLAIVAIVAVALAGLGAWSYGRVDESLRELRHRPRGLPRIRGEGPRALVRGEEARGRTLVGQCGAGDAGHGAGREGA